MSILRELENLSCGALLLAEGLAHMPTSLGKVETALLAERKRHRAQRSLNVLLGLYLLEMGRRPERNHAQVA